MFEDVIALRGLMKIAMRYLNFWILTVTSLVGVKYTFNSYKLIKLCDNLNLNLHGSIHLLVNEYILLYIFICYMILGNVYILYITE